MTSINHAGHSAVSPTFKGHRSTFVGEKDVHFVVNTATHRLKCFLAGGKMKYMIEARCEGVGGSCEYRYGATPPGLYKCGSPEMIPLSDPESASYGPWFVDLIEQQNQERSRGRAGVGVHGGGGGLSNPYASRPEWN